MKTKEMVEIPLILLASARKQGDTRKFIEAVFAKTDHEIIDLLDYNISSFNYLNEYPKEDSFLKIIEALLGHKKIVFATPVYWYAMSGLMKTFLDRFTGLVTAQKHIGRQLKGKSIFLLAVGTDKALPDGFEIPFQLTSAYFGMLYQADIYCSEDDLKSGNKLDIIIQPFINKFSRIAEP
jgi:multimeric flavodoxin WrbA